jgi:hypothetical protein
MAEEKRTCLYCHGKFEPSTSDAKDKQSYCCIKHEDAEPVDGWYAEDQ